MEVGTDGVVLCTDDANEVRTLYIAVQEMNMRDSKVTALYVAEVSVLDASAFCLVSCAL